MRVVPLAYRKPAILRICVDHAISLADRRPNNYGDDDNDSLGAASMAMAMTLERLAKEKKVNNFSFQLSNSPYFFTASSITLLV